MISSKLRITMKDPDAGYEDIEEYVRESLAASGLSRKEMDAVEEVRKEEIREKLSKWLKYGEYLEVEFDLADGTATVIPQE